MIRPLLEGASSVVDVIRKFLASYKRNPTRKEFFNLCLQLGNTPEEIDDYIDTAIDARIVDYDERTDILTNATGI